MIEAEKAVEEDPVTGDSLPADLVARILMKLARLESFLHAGMVCKG